MGGPGAVKDVRRTQGGDRLPDAIAIEQVDGLPPRDAGDLGRRDRPCPGHEIVGRRLPAEAGSHMCEVLKEVAAGEPGSARHEDRA